MSSLVHVIDDDEAVRDSLAALLTASDLDVRTYPSATAFLEKLEEAEAGCVVTDVRMPAMSGLDLLKRLDGRLKQFPTVVLTGEADVPMAVEALKTGACDFIEKPFEPETMLSAVRTALSRLQDGREKAGGRSEMAQRIAALSPRERDVLDGILAGQANKEIARSLGISFRTVEAYRAKLMAKMEAESVAELVQLALKARAES
jgi:two-component system response regulator FixJ